MLVSGGRQEARGLLVAEVVLSLKVSIRENNENQGFSSFQYMEVTDLIDIVDETTEHFPLFPPLDMRRLPLLCNIQKIESSSSFTGYCSGITSAVIKIYMIGA